MTRPLTILALTTLFVWVPAVSAADFALVKDEQGVTVKLNGEVVIDNARLPEVPPEGEIALQRHGNPIEFKNIYIKELKPE